MSGRSGDWAADVQIVDENSVRGGDGHERAKRNIDRLGKADVCHIVASERDEPERIESHRRNECAECHIRQREVHALVTVVRQHGLARGGDAENFDGCGRGNVGQFDVNAIFGVAADRVVARDADARRVGVADPDVHAIAHVVVDRIRHPVTGHTDHGRADVVDVHMDPIPGDTIERSGQSDHRQVHSGVVEAVRTERIAGDGVGSGRQQKCGRPRAGRIQSHAEATVVRGGNRVEPRGHDRAVCRLKIEAVSGIPVGEAVVKQHQSRRTDSVRSHERTVEIGRSNRAVVIEVRVHAAQVQLATGFDVGDQSTLPIEIRSAVLKLNFGQRSRTRREHSQTGTRGVGEVGIQQASIEPTPRIDDRVQAVTHNEPPRPREVGVSELQIQDTGVVDLSVHARRTRVVADRVGQGDRRHTPIDEGIQGVVASVVEGRAGQRDRGHAPTEDIRIDESIHGIDASVVEGRPRGGRIHDGAKAV